MPVNNLEKVEVVEHTIEYKKPKFWHRVVANLIDIFIFIMTGFLAFVGCRSIVEATPTYQKIDQEFTQIRLDSGLYMKNPSSGEIIDIVSYLENNVKVYGDDFDGNKSIETSSPLYTKIGCSVNAIEKFRKYIELDGILDKALKEELIADFDNYYKKLRLETYYEGIPYFILENDVIIPNPILTNDATKRHLYFENIFSKCLDNYCMGFLAKNVTDYYSILKTYSTLVLALEIPVAYVLSAILTFYVPGLIFKRGRKTFGKALYHIGLIDQKTVLNPTVSKFTLRFLVFLFAELVLSLVTLGLPYLISFTMMAFSKNKQGFPDYMMNTMEVDISNNNIYLDYVEAQIKESLHGKAIDFSMKKPL